MLLLFLYLTMKNLSILPELTKMYILERVTQEEIMEYYTNIKVNDITLTGNSFTSPLRIDNNPTCNYYYKEDSKGEVRLKLKDWNGSFDGDIFDVASYKTKINSKTSQGFKLLLHQIAKDFKLHKYSSKEERAKLDIIVQEHIKRKELKVFKIIPRRWNDYDKRYWIDKFGISFELLRLGKVIPVDQLEIEGKDGFLTKTYRYTARDPAYAYYGGEINGIKLWRIYFPLRRNGGSLPRFISNYAFIQGLHIFEPARICIITKSYKDVLTYKTFGITAVAPAAETHLITKDEYFYLKSNCDVIVTNFDYDKAGILLANKYKIIHNCLPLMFTKGKYNQPDFGVKDFSEYRETYGREGTINLINTIVDKYKEDLESINNYNYNSLKWLM